MKKHLSLILCLAMILTFVPFGTALASEDTATEGTENPIYISETIDITSPAKAFNVYSNQTGNAFTKKAFAKENETASLGWDYLYSYNQSHIIDIDDMKDTIKFNWKDTAWTSAKNTLTYNGIDYVMNVVSATEGRSALDLSSWYYAQYNVTENHYDKISILANGVSNGNTTKTLGVVLNYTDGSVVTNTDPVYWGMDSNIKNQSFWKGFEVSGVSTSDVDSNRCPSGSFSKATATHYINAYEVEVDSTKTLKSIVLLGANIGTTVSDGNVTYSQAQGTHAGTNIFAITAVTTQETLNAVTLSKLETAINAIDVDSLAYNDASKILMKNLYTAIKECQNDNITIPEEKQTKIDEINKKWDTLKPISKSIVIPDAKYTKAIYANFGETINLSWNNAFAVNYAFAVHLNSFKGNNDLIWKNQWKKGTDGKYLDTDYRNTLILNDIDYNLVARNGGGALDLGNKTTIDFDVEQGHYDKVSILAGGNTQDNSRNKKIGVVLTYDDGTQEYKTTDYVYGAFYKSDNGFEVSKVSFSGGNGFNGVYTTGTEANGTFAYNVYDIEVNSAKTLKKIGIAGCNAGVTVNDDGTVTVAEANGTHANANIFAVTAVTTQETYKKNKPINETIDISKDYHILSYTDYNETFEVNYDHLGMYSYFAISLQNMKNDYTWDKDYNVLTWNGVNYRMPVRQSVSEVKDDPDSEEDETVQKVAGAINNGGNKAFTYSVTPSYYEKINVMANGYGGRYSQLQGNNITSGAVIKLTYEDGTSEYKETETVYQYANGNIEKESFYSTINTIKVPAVKLTGLNNGCLGTATSESQNYSDQYGNAYIYIQPYEITVDSTKRLTSVTVVGTGSDADAEYISSRTQGIANTNIFGMTAITSNSTVETSANVEIGTILGTLDKENLTYNSENFEKISKLTKLLDLCEENGYTVENETQVNEMLTAWENCQKATMQIVSTSYERNDSGNEVTLSVTAKAIENTTNATVIFAIYNKTNNNLLEVYNENKTFETTSVVSLSHTFDTSSYDATQYVVKCFVWNSLTGEDALKAYMYSVEK